MKFRRTTTEYSCGVDLHSRQMYICVMDREGNKRVHTNVAGNDSLEYLGAGLTLGARLSRSVGANISLGTELDTKNDAAEGSWIRASLTKTF